MKKTYITLTACTLVLVAGAFASTANASHTWGNYHWARTTSPFALKLGDNISAAWDAHLAQMSADWSLSSVLDTVVVPGKSNPKNCRATAGQVEVCNSKYGRNGWLGIATIWTSGEHIAQGTVKLNDTYFNTAKYNTPAWRNLVMCQEVGHMFGLDHQDENFSNAPLGTCMDYTNDPTPNQQPNAHDYEMLETIYAHLDASSTASQTSVSNGRQVDRDYPSAWGKAIRTASDGRGVLYLKDFGNGEKAFTFVIWAEGEERG